MLLRLKSWNPRPASGVVGLVEGRPPTEQELVSRAQRGDVDAYERIVETYQGIAFRVAYVLCGDATEAEDAAQEGFVKAFRALPRFRPGAPLRPWLLQIVANEARNRRRAAGRRANLALRAAAEGRPGDAAPSPEVAVIGAEQRSELFAALNRLREEERLVVACRYFLDLSEAETAAALHVRPGTVKSRLSRALDHLRAAMEASHA
jgi:RNA polymerase sigma factor (sigma-70 family)